MAGFKGGIESHKKVKFVPKNAQNKGGIVGAKRERLEAEKKVRLEKTLESKRETPVQGKREKPL